MTMMEGASSMGTSGSSTTGETGSVGVVSSGAVGVEGISGTVVPETGTWGYAAGAVPFTMTLLRTL